KTIAGSVAGFLGSLFGGYYFKIFYFPELDWLPLTAALILCAFVAQSGDLFASLLKRVAHVKDSGKIMPGHGGALDRLDGIYFCAPILYIYVSLVLGLS